MILLVEMDRHRKVISPINDISTVLPEPLRQPTTSLPDITVNRHLVHVITVNYVDCDTGIMSCDINLPFGCCYCGRQIDMGTCTVNGPVTREGSWWFVNQ